MFPFETWEQCAFFSENVAVNLYPLSVVFQSNRSCMLSVEFSLYLASIFVGKFEGKIVCEIRVKEGVEGSERVSGIDKDVSDEMSIVSFTKFGSP